MASVFDGGSRQIWNLKVAARPQFCKSKGPVEVCIGVNGLPQVPLKSSPSHYCVLLVVVNMASMSSILMKNQGK